MTIRTDFSYNMEVSPRIITVAAPSVEVTIQDLHDTISDYQDSPEGGQYPHLIESAGKEVLGGGVLVGITATLQNALLAFEARSGPTYTQCNVSGGNLVAVDANGDPVTSPISPTAFTQVVIANSSSATLQEQDAIQYASFNGGVWYDSTSSNTGTTFPVGSPQAPVNNVYDAYDIAVERGFAVGYLLSDLTMPTDLPLTGFTFIGQGKDRTLITVPDLATVSSCTYIDAEVTGYLDGNNTLRDCLITNLNYIRGYIESCVLSAGTITLAGSDVAHFLDCYSGQPGLGTPTIDLGGSGQDLALRNYNGGIRLINKTGTDDVSIDLNSGQIVIDDTVNAGIVVLRGIGEWVNASTYAGNATVIEQLVEGDKLHALHRSAFNRRRWDKVADTVTIYDDDGVTPLYVFDTNSDLSELTPQ